MKTCIKSMLMGVLFAFLGGISLSAYGDDPNPPVVPGEHGKAGDVPVGAPLDGGLSILLILGAGYGAKKIYSRKENREEKTTE